MPIFVGNYSGNKILGLTKTTKEQWNIHPDTIFHSQLPYVRVIEHELTSFTWVQEKMWQQEFNTPYWYQTHPDGPGYQPQTIWWCGQSFPLTDQLKNMLQNTSRGFMIFIQWNDGWWEPYNPVVPEHAWLYAWDYQAFTDQDNRNVANHFKNFYTMTKYTTNLFIPRMRLNNGTGKVSNTQYVTKVRILELVGLNVTTNGDIQLAQQNPAQNQAIYIDNTKFLVGSTDVMQEKYLGLMLNTTQANQTQKTHNVQQDIVYPQNLSYTMNTMDLVSSNRTLGGKIPRNNPPVIMGTGSTQPTWEALAPILYRLVVKSLTNSWNREPPSAWVQPGGVNIPRLGAATNYDTYVHQPQSVRRDDFIGRGIGQEQASQSKMMQVQVLQGSKFGTGVHLDARIPSIGRGNRQLFSPQSQGVQRLGTPIKLNIPREALEVSGIQDTTIYQFHHKVQLQSFTLPQADQTQNAFLLTQYQRFFPLIGGTQQVFKPTCQVTTIPPTSSSNSVKKTKRSTQDGEVGYQILNCTVNDSFAVQHPSEFSHSGILKQEEQSRQVHQIYLQSGDKYILSESESGVNSSQQPNAVAGIIHYLERSGNTIYLMSETYINQSFADSYGYMGAGALFTGGFGVSLVQVL